ncbi:putative TLC domain-containing protein [Helianthus annuus]|uniref:Putative TRAM/LAG1/CLN8-like domain-containing protein n=1 Tax=Helianthus annuus TaxID=4232 RepID=A0A251S7E5_HELAN|nr:TLC domain-containing protein At5g14285 [Helianthus annuus]KAF5763922.1 putative TLC domain-containing protein [Helianthus annuus]KAJ0472529.1 putative TLC domain-containing protein [Helianthus annuus]KAJ0648131.1 putative TLC domain-containing protein [Helianthus annuus]KAJ0651978.1 putative TLC domain-containing protein [Helianthus annuus]KAJ0830671.1 putative TLC domain-containing protein [Helianthus annuus]
MDIKTLIISPPPPLPVFFTMFLTIYLLAHFIIFRNWTPKTRPEAASCLISLTHGTPAAILAGIAIFSDPKHHFASPNTRFQNSVLEYSIAYFIMDLIHYLTFYPTDVLFIGHHLATLFVFVTCRYVAFHGAYSVLILLVLAEVTSLLQNVWTLAGARKGDSEVARQVFDKMSVWFYGVYSVVRGVGAPLFVYRMVGFYASGVADSVVPRWLWVSWVCVVVAAISVSVLWVSNNWVELFRERGVRVEKGKKVW